MDYDDEILTEEQTFRLSDDDNDDEAFDPLEGPDMPEHFDGGDDDLEDDDSSDPDSSYS